jgi:hypothetical protein
MMGQEIESVTPDGRPVKMSVRALIKLIGAVAGHWTMIAPLGYGRVARLKVEPEERIS